MRLISIGMTVVGLLAMAFAAFGQVMPDRAKTPGATNPILTKAVLCSPSFRTGLYRKLLLSEKRAACASYGRKTGCPGPKWELDHSVPLEVGGSNLIANIWPQAIEDARIKDKYENAAHRAICRGVVDLKTVQHCFETDWTKCKF